MDNHARYLYHILLGIDGNHSLHKKSKRDDPRDVSLAPGQVFFIDHSTMKDALKEKYWQEEIVSSQLSHDSLHSTDPAYI